MQTAVVTAEEELARARFPIMQLFSTSIRAGWTDKCHRRTSFVPL